MRMKDDGAYLVKGREYIIGELNLRNSRLAHCCYTNSETSNTLL